MELICTSTRATIANEGLSEYSATGDNKGEHDVANSKQHSTTTDLDLEGDIMASLGNNIDNTAIATAIDRLIEEAKRDMTVAAKALDFKLAAKHRDRMYELQHLRKKLTK